MVVFSLTLFFLGNQQAVEIYLNTAGPNLPEYFLRVGV